MTYPPAPTKGGNPNAEASEGVVQGMASALSRTRQQEAEFRARQYARRLRTRGLAAMQPHTAASVEVPVLPPEIPDDPIAQAYAAAGLL